MFTSAAIYHRDGGLRGRVSSIEHHAFPSMACNAYEPAVIAFQRGPGGRSADWPLRQAGIDAYSMVELLRAMKQATRTVENDFTRRTSAK